MRSGLLAGLNAAAALAMFAMFAVLAMFALLPGRAFAADGCRPATEFTPALCPAHLPAIRSVRVERDRLRSTMAPDVNVDCKRFRLTGAAVRRYLGQAWRVSEANVEHAVDRGPCEAQGRLQLADGRSGRWRIEQVGTATLWLGQAPALTLYCPDCDFAPFVERP